MHPTDSADPDGEQRSLQIQYRYTSSNGKYYIFFIYHEVKGRASDNFSHSEYVRFAVYPTDGVGGAILEPIEAANYGGSQQALEAAQRVFWDMVNG